jgi:ABC-type polysaccharide/polyol phosphate export permease
VEILPITLLVGTMILFAPLGLISIGTGLILNSVTARFRELNQIMRRMIRSHVKS